jgi:hypothetical protein
MVAMLPATFPVDVDAYYANAEGVPTRLEVPALAEGAVCFVGRDQGANRVLQLIMTEHSCDGIIDAVAALEFAQVAERAQTAFSHVRNTPDLRHVLTNGISLKCARDSGWAHIPSETGAENGVSKMGLLAWNYTVSTKPLGNRDLSKAGIILLVKDRAEAEAPGLDAAVRSGLVQPDLEKPAPEQID